MTESFTGQAYTSWTTTNLQVKPRAGRVAKLIVNTAPSANGLTVYDTPNGSTANPPVWSSPQPLTAGQILPVDIPCATGIYLVVPTAGAGIIVYS